jgi:hypothetical protein
VNQGIVAVIGAGLILFAAANWLYDGWRRPYTTCRKCRENPGQNSGSTRISYGRCRRCKGKPERLKRSARLVNRRWGK